jgi:hypothetical protein
VNLFLNVWLVACGAALALVAGVLILFALAVV